MDSLANPIDFWKDLFNYTQIFQLSLSPYILVGILDLLGFICKQNKGKSTIPIEQKNDWILFVLDMLNRSLTIILREVSFQYSTKLEYYINIIDKNKKKNTSVVSQSSANRPTSLVKESFVLKDPRILLSQSILQNITNIFDAMPIDDKSYTIQPSRLRSFFEKVFQKLQNRAGLDFFAVNVLSDIVLMFLQYSPIFVFEFKMEILDCFDSEDFFKCCSKGLSAWTLIIDKLLDVCGSTILSDHLEQLNK